MRCELTFLQRMDIIGNTEITAVPVSRLQNNTGQIAGVPENPRTITRDKFERLKQRIMRSNLLGVFPLKVFRTGGKYVTLGGNQRLRAAKAIGLKEVPCIILPDETDAETLREVVILENTHDGDNDWDAMANSWDAVELADWGVDAANWGIEPEKAKKKTKEKRRCVFIELEEDGCIVIGGTQYSAGDTIDAATLRSYLQ